jgi:hypothetical protein
VLPRGFPHSVTPNYLRYAQWTAVGLVAGRVQSVLATQAALLAVGVGAGAIPLAATIQWLLKDGVGHAAAIVYASVVSTRFDADAKRFRFQATCALTFADFLAVCMPLAPQHFLAMASVSAATSSIAHIAQASSRARIMAAFARRGNLADCTRAGQTQSKIASLVGTAAGVAAAWLIGPSPLQVLGCMAPLAGVSLYAMYESSRLVVLATINLQASPAPLAIPRPPHTSLLAHTRPSRRAVHTRRSLRTSAPSSSSSTCSTASATAAR